MNTPKYSTALMMKHGPLNYSTDISILTHSAPDHPAVFGQVYADSDTQGFLLVSAKSGREMRMHLIRTGKDESQEVTHWVFESDADDARRLSTPVLTIIVWNT